MKLNTAIISSDAPAIDFKVYSDEELRKQVKTPHSNAVRMLLKLLAYDKQDELLPSKWEIEHILPQKWHKDYFINIPDEEIKNKIEHLGNKIPFEKKLNIEAGNNYFTKKKELYKGSKVAITKAIGEDESLNEWGLDSIIERDVVVADSIVSIMDRWRSDFANEGVAQTKPTLTEEQRALLEQLKATGLDVSSLN